MHIELMSIIVNDYDQAIAFFIDILGFELVEDTPSMTNDGHPKRWVVVRAAGSQIGLLLAQADGERQRAAVGDQFAGRVGLFLRVDDFDVTYERMVERGVEFVTVPRDEPFGRFAVFLDIAGNRWDLLGPALATTNAGAATERAGLITFLDYQREALITKVEGLSIDQARTTATVSSLSLLSLIKHSAIWERRWFQVIVTGRNFPGEWPESARDVVDATFLLSASDTVESVVADYRKQIAASNEILRTYDLDTPCARPEIAHQNLRWVALHLIEETARHAGHGDIIRESIDGTRCR